MRQNSRAGILFALDWLCAWLLEETAAQCDGLVKEGQTAFDVRNNSQTFYAAKLAIVYGEVSSTEEVEEEKVEWDESGCTKFENHI